MTITVTRCCDKCKKTLEVFEWEKNKKIICLECLKMSKLPLYGCEKVETIKEKLLK